MSPLKKQPSDLCLGSKRCRARLRRTRSCPNFTTPPDKPPPPNVDWIEQEVFMQPRLSVWTFTNQEETEALANMDLDEARLFICDKLLDMGWNGLGARFTCELLSDALVWALSQGWDSPLVSALLGILFDTHRYFLGSRSRTYRQTYIFCRESILLHCIEDTRKAVRLLAAPESVKILKYICETYLTMLPLLRVSLLPNYRLELTSEETETTTRSKKKHSVA